MAFEKVGVQAVVQGYGPYMQKLGTMEDKAKGFGSKIGPLLKKGALVGGVAVAGLGTAAIKMGMDFEKSMAEVKTLMPDVSEKAFGKMRDDTIALSKEMGIATNKSVPALYQAISAGIPRENVMEFMEVASKAAIGGVTDLTTTVDGLTTIVNAFGYGAEGAGRAADVMFAGVKLGKTTMQELSSAMFQAAPLAASLGLDIEDVVAATASLTKQGTPTTIAMTQIRQAMVALSKPTADMVPLIEATGYQSGKALLEAEGFAGALDVLTKAAKGDTEVMAKAFGSVEALQAVLGLTGENAAGAAADLDTITNSAGGADAAFKTMTETTSYKLNKSLNELNIMMMELGTELLPLIIPAMQGVVFMAGTLTEALHGIIAPIKEIADLIDVAFGKMPSKMELGKRALQDMAANAEITKDEFIELAQEGLGMTLEEAEKLAADTEFPSAMDLWRQKALDFGLSAEEVDEMWEKASAGFKVTSEDIAFDIGQMEARAEDFARDMEDDVGPTVGGVLKDIGGAADEARSKLLAIFKEPTAEEAAAEAALASYKYEAAELESRIGTLTGAEGARLNLLNSELIPTQESSLGLLRLERDAVVKVAEAEMGSLPAKDAWIKKVQEETDTVSNLNFQLNNLKPEYLVTVKTQVRGYEVSELAKRLIAGMPVAGMQHGAWDIPRDMLARLHPGEMVLPRPQAQVVRDVVMARPAPALDTSGLVEAVRQAGGFQVNLYGQPVNEAQAISDAFRRLAFSMGKV